MNCDSRRRVDWQKFLALYNLAGGLIFGAFMFLLGAGFALLMPIGLLASPGDFWLAIANALAALVIGSIVAVVSWWIMCQQMRRLLAILDKCEEEVPKGK